MNIGNLKKTVYLVDDEFSVRDALTLFLESTGLSVRSFDSAESFLENYQAGQLDCLLLDVHMPFKNGLELQEELNRRNILIPIIFISGQGNVPISSKAFRGGAYDFLEKPFDDKILLERINEALDQVLLNWGKQQNKKEIFRLYADLTNREQEVMKLIIRGYSNKESARLLNISNRTIEIHRSHLMEKMKAESLADLIIKGSICEIV